MKLDFTPNWRNLIFPYVTIAILWIQTTFETLSMTISIKMRRSALYPTSSSNASFVLSGTSKVLLPAFSLTKLPLIPLYFMSSSQPKTLEFNFCFTTWIPFLSPNLQTVISLHVPSYSPLSFFCFVLFCPCSHKGFLAPFTLYLI